VRQIDEWTDKLAELAVFGANVQPGQLVAITSFIGKEDLTRRIAREAYRRGAKYVDVLYFDQWVKRERIALAPDDTLDYIPPWMSQRMFHLSDEHAARISLSGPHAPRALDGLDPARAGRDILPYLPETGEVVNRMTTSWCIVPAPTRSWAEVVYPELEREEAYAALWDAIAHVCRLEAPEGTLQGSALPVAAAGPQDRRSGRRGLRAGGIGRAIIHDDHLVDERQQSRDAGPDPPGLVARRDERDDTSAHGGGGSGSAPSLTP